ncbi:sec-independent protein translocase protein TatB [Actinomycetospora sp. NBRC 106375]|uniref:Sec-independent protein translocase protein TatB n=1 Tax=Actinomycetospora sp. NBRC 106375 TaxID=3032207 RepID=UPI0024A27164|nr:Sec-independent protein translocase protein TatB [Actinomycetospora sp. NBRC 106375]GLZ46723.1 sec-independent protein translocase protein TatB [Actinomycetospora sp. NBRC 106375]
MFDNIGWPELLVLALVGLFVLGPERLPAAAAWVANTVRTIRDYATGARDQLRQELGPEFDEFRKPLEDLRSVRDLDPRRAVRQHLFTDPPADGTWSGSATPAAASTPAITPSAPTSSTPSTPSTPRAGRADSGPPLKPGEIAPVDPDAT